MTPSTWILMVAALLAPLVGVADAGHPVDTRVLITQFKFQPAEVRVAPGETVTWVNNDAEEHTVTATDRSYTSTGLEPTETFSHRFTARGRYQYFCALHPHMTATVVVE